MNVWLGNLVLFDFIDWIKIVGILFVFYFFVSMPTTVIFYMSRNWIMHALSKLSFLYTSKTICTDQF